MDIKQVERVLTGFEREGLVDRSHLFIVKNRTAHPSRQKWVPVEGTVIGQFLNGSHDYQYFGPNDRSMTAKLLRLDMVNAGELRLEDIDAVPDDGPEEDGLPPAAKQPARSSKKTGD